VRRGLGARAATALLLAAASALLVLRAATALAGAWRAAGDATFVRLVAALAAPAALGCALAVRSAAGALLARVPGRALRTATTLAAVVQAAALGGVLWQVARESHGLVGAVAEAASAVQGVPERRAAAPAADPPRHLVLVTIDTLRADHLDAARMPHLTALAADGVRFDDALAAAPWTLPAVASLLTGMPAAHHGAGVPTGVDPLARSPLPPDRATLAEHLTAAGFVARAVVTNPYLGLGFGLGRGFASFENLTLESEAVLTLRPTLGWWVLEHLLPVSLLTDLGAAVTARAARVLRAHDPEQRLFLWLHYVDPHAPYDGATRSFRGDLLATASGHGGLPRMAQLRAGEIRPDAEGRRALREAYAGAVRAADAQIGAVVRLLEERGLAASTLLVVTADHGEEFWEHGGVEHGHTLYDELVRVPLVVRGPGCRRAGARVGVPVGVEQLAATLLDVLGVAPLPGAAGALAPGFAALLRGGPYAPRPVVSENLLFAEERVALRDARYTYVVWPSGKEELYDRRRDPGERQDLAARRRLVRARRALLAVTRRTAASSGDGDAPRGGAATAPLTRRALRALGYVE
jgi:arylsulfatase A-like enzyme